MVEIIQLFASAYNFISCWYRNSSLIFHLSGVKSSIGREIKVLGDNTVHSLQQEELPNKSFVNSVGFCVLLSPQHKPSNDKKQNCSVVLQGGLSRQQKCEQSSVRLTTSAQSWQR